MIYIKEIVEKVIYFMYEKMSEMIPKRSLRELEIGDAETDLLTCRILILMAFKDTNTQNLRFLLSLLGVRTHNEMKNVTQEIFRFIRKGILYVPKGFSQLIDTGFRLSVDHLFEVENISLCLLCPYDKLIQEIEKEVEEHRWKKKESELQTIGYH